ncbi:MAG: succinate--CoA ligase subunit alpha [Verrucomicrobiota bacterium]|nr:succinate--CoA ligase subunit alpha [Verrucomicrobiota bacterium]MEC7908341.1 succinate--CoA ligase subunit alpha [Verrucomicrobiota bacterium]MEC8517581.1 succinate--CoA ligase subunit alpha [Verrucomicrobiota bacterium]MEC8752976.1 succinate--CoA ligase subunit alpha [Verrucomicrobiota bacterium]
MSILVNKDSRIIVQGITGSEGSFHAEQCLVYGGNVVGGVTPGKGGQMALDGKVPVFDSCFEARNEVHANVSLIFVPPPFAADAIMEAAAAGIELIVCITEGIPVAQMVEVKSFVEHTDSRFIGPNCPGILTPEEAKVGIMPGFIAKKGHVGVISKSGTLTYEAVDQLVQAGLGQSTCVGIGGDPIIGTSMKDLLEMFEKDDGTEAVVLIGEIGGSMELEAAEYVREHMNKPVVGFIAGQTAPPGRRMGHAGAIVSGADESAAAKKAFMKECGLVVVESPANIGKTVATILK